MENWIAPHHLTSTALEQHRRRFESDPNQSIVFDNLFIPERLDALRSLFREDGVFKPIRTEYHQTEVLEKPQRADNLSLGWAAFLLFRAFFASPSMLQFLRGATGIDPVSLLNLQARIMTRANYIGPHNDGRPNRTLCGVVYVGENWRESDGGCFRFVNSDGSTRVIEPLPNRMLLFRVGRKSHHDVEPMSAVAPPRWTFSVWFGTPKKDDPSGIV